MLQDLGLLQPQKKIYVISLPSGSQSVIARHSPGLKISCVVSPQKLKVRIKDSENFNDGVSKIQRCKIQIPHLILTIDYADVPRFGRVLPIAEYLFAIDVARKDSIWTTPYRFPNVYSDGKICWGNLKCPPDLKSSFSTFWGSSFTDELINVEMSVLDYIKRYRTQFLKKQIYQDRTQFFCGDRFFAAPKGSEGILYTDEESLVRLIPSTFWIKVSADDRPKICLLANKKGEIWEFESGSYKFSLPQDLVSTQVKDNPKFEALKSKFSVA